MVQPGASPTARTIAINDLAQLVKEGRIKSISVTDDQGTAVTTADQRYSFRTGQGTTAPSLLRDFGATPDDLSRVNSVVTSSTPAFHTLPDIVGISVLLGTSVLSFGLGLAVALRLRVKL